MKPTASERAAAIRKEAAERDAAEQAKNSHNRPAMEQPPADIHFDSIEELHDRLRAMRTPEVEPKPMEPTARQWEQTQAEMARGAEVLKKHAAQAAHRPQPKPDSTEGRTEPVYRPDDKVPNFQEGKGLNARTL